VARATARRAASRAPTPRARRRRRAATRANSTGGKSSRARSVDRRFGESASTPLATARRCGPERETTLTSASALGVVAISGPHPRQLRHPLEAALEHDAPLVCRSTAMRRVVRACQQVVDAAASSWGLIPRDGLAELGAKAVRPGAGARLHPRKTEDASSCSGRDALTRRPHLSRRGCHLGHGQQPGHAQVERAVLRPRCCARVAMHFSSIRRDHSGVK